MVDPASFSPDLVLKEQGNPSPVYPFNLGLVPKSLPSSVFPGIEGLTPVPLLLDLVLKEQGKMRKGSTLLLQGSSPHIQETSQEFDFSLAFFCCCRCLPFYHRGLSPHILNYVLRTAFFKYVGEDPYDKRVNLLSFIFVLSKEKESGLTLLLLGKTLDGFSCSFKTRTRRKGRWVNPCTLNERHMRAASLE